MESSDPKRDLSLGGSLESMDERRSQPRTNISIVILHPSGANPEWGRTKNLSMGGLFIADGKGEVGTEITIMIFEDVKLYVTQARIAHRSESGTGLQFLNPPDDLLDFIRRLQLEADGPTE